MLYFPIDHFLPFEWYNYNSELSNKNHMLEIIDR